VTDGSGDVARPTRRQQRLINFVVSQLQANEQIEQILSVAHEKVPFWLLGPTAAIVLTDERVFEIRLQLFTARPKKTLAAHARESITAEWTRDAHLVFTDVGGGGHYAGKLSIAGPSGTKTFWVRERRRDRAQGIAAALNTRRTT
jgi:hypothetical protein